LLIFTPVPIFAPNARNKKIRHPSKNNRGEGRKSSFQTIPHKTRFTKIAFDHFVRLFVRSSSPLITYYCG
jgi:hypothetical protein